MAAKDREQSPEDRSTILHPYSQPWWRQPHLVRLNLLLSCTMLFSGTMGYDNSMMNGLQTLHTWQSFMKEPKGTYLGGINATQAAGSCLGYGLMSTIANVYGRKASIYAGVIVLVFGTALQTAAHNPAMFIASRLFVGIAGGLFGSAPALIAECAHPEHRGRMTAAFNCFYYVGSLLSAWVTYGTRNYTSSWGWRVPSLVQICLPLVAIGPLLFTPESPRWLFAKGRSDEARQILCRYHAGGDEISHLVKVEMAEIEKALELEAAVKQTSWMDMLRTKGNRHRTLISLTLGIFAQWSGNGVVSYYLSLVLDTVGLTSVKDQTLINGFLQVWNLLLALLASSLVDRIGRRLLFLLSSVGMLVSYSTITGLSATFAQTGSSSVGLAVVPMLFVYFGFYDIAYTPLLLAYPTEIWPYELRSRGIALTCIATFAALFINLFVNPIGLEALAWRYYFVYIAILVVMCLVTYFCYVETRGYSLEEIAVVFDGDDAPDFNPSEHFEVHVRVDRKTEYSMAVKRKGTSIE